MRTSLRRRERRPCAGDGDQHAADGRPDQAHAERTDELVEEFASSSRSRGTTSRTIPVNDGMNNALPAP
jgi:hypothetical protein